MASARTGKDPTVIGKPGYGPNVELPAGTADERQAGWKALVDRIRATHWTSDGQPYYTNRDELHERD